MSGDETPSLEEIVARIDAIPDETAKEEARALARGILDLHRRGLARMLELSRKVHGARGWLDELANDPLVGSLLVLHDLHPEDLVDRVSAAIGRLQGAYPDLAFERLDQGRLRVTIGARGGAAAAAANAVEASLFEQVPDLVAIEVAVAQDPPLLQIRRKDAAP